MTIQELERKLNNERVPKNMYSLLIGGFPNEAFCLVKQDDIWEVYYSEHGKKRGIKQFYTESEACEYLYEKLKKREGAN